MQSAVNNESGGSGSSGGKLPSLDEGGDGSSDHEGERNQDSSADKGKGANDDKSEEGGDSAALAANPNPDPIPDPAANPNPNPNLTPVVYLKKDDTAETTEQEVHYDEGQVVCNMSSRVTLEHTTRCIRQRPLTNSRLIAVSVPRPAAAGSTKITSNLHFFSRNSDEGILEHSSLQMTADSIIVHPSQTRRVVAVLGSSKLTILDLDRRTKLCEQPMSAPLVFWGYSMGMNEPATVVIVTSTAIFLWRPLLETAAGEATPKPVKAGDRGDLREGEKFVNRRVYDVQIMMRSGNGGRDRQGTWLSLLSCPRKNAQGVALSQLEQHLSSLVVLRDIAREGQRCVFRALSCSVISGEGGDGDHALLVLPIEATTNTEAKASASVHVQHACLVRVRLATLMDAFAGGSPDSPTEAEAVLAKTDAIVWVSAPFSVLDVDTGPAGPAVWVQVLDDVVAVLTRAARLHILSLETGRVASVASSDVSGGRGVVLSACACSTGSSLLVLFSQGPTVVQLDCGRGRSGCLTVHEALMPR